MSNHKNRLVKLEKQRGANIPELIIVKFDQETARVDDTCKQPE